MSENWFVPCNVRFYDVVEHFKNSNTIVWRRMFSIRKDDVVYLYLGKPYSEIKYKCHVLLDDVDEITLESNSYAIKNCNTWRKPKYMQLQLDYEYPEGVLSLEQLCVHGLGQTQSQARTDRKLQAFINETNVKLGV